MSDAATVQVANVDSFSGTGKRGEWTAWKLVDGNGTEYVTFDGKLGGTLAVLQGKKADITYSPDKKGLKLESAFEHIEPKKAGGSRYDDPVVQHRITVLACMKVASEIVNEAAPDGTTTAERAAMVKMWASDLAVWTDEYAERAANPPFVEDDGIEFGE